MEARKSANRQKRREVKPSAEEGEVNAPPRKKSKKVAKKLPVKKTEVIVGQQEPDSFDNKAAGSEPELQNNVEVSNSEPMIIESNAESAAAESYAEPITSESTEPITESDECPDWSRLPVEMLEKIFKNCDNQIALSETCSNFSKVAVPQALSLDLDRINNEGIFPVFPSVKRAYNTVKLVGRKVRGVEVEFERTLRSSQSSTRKLVLGRRLNNVPAPYWDKNWSGGWKLFLPDVRRLGGQISAQRFQYLLNFFPNIENIEIQGFATFIRGTTRLEVMELPKLKKLCMRNSSNDFLTFFSRVRTLEELTIEGYYDRKLATAIQNLITSQKGLNSLDVNYAISLQGITFTAADSLPNLHTFKGIIDGWFIFNIFALAPNLKHLELAVDNVSRQSQRSLRAYLRSVNSLTLETLVIEGYSGDVNEFRANFPLANI